MSVSMPNTWRTEIFMSGRPDAVSELASIRASCGRAFGATVAWRASPRTAFLSVGTGPAQFHSPHNACARETVRERSASAEARALQRVVGLDDVAQALLEGAVAAMGVRVEALHQSLVLRLDRGRVGGLVEPERVERPLYDAAVAPLRRLGGLSLRLGEALCVKYPERIEISPVPRGPARLVAVLLGCAVHAHREGRAVADDGVLLIGLDRVVRHAGEVVVRGVVLAHMPEAKAPVLALAPTALGGA